MNYRTKTYLAAAWDEDHDAIEKLYSWNDNDYYSLEFRNIHDFKQSRDDSLPCSIKDSLSKRMDMCKLFILIVGEKTNKVTKGFCSHCRNYRSWSAYCSSSKMQGNKSYIDFECDRAKRDYNDGKIKILVLYNSSYVYRDRCPESLRNIGIHQAMKTNGLYDYQKVKTAFWTAQL